MKKLLTIAILLLALAFTIVACTESNQPDDTTVADDTSVEIPTEAPTNEPDETTAEPDETTAEPEETTEEVTTEEVTTEEVTTEEVTTADPADPVWILDAENINDLANVADASNTAGELKDGYVSLTAKGDDPWFKTAGNLGEMPAYLAIRYRTNSTVKGELFISGDAGPAAGKSFTFDYNADGEWNLLVFHLPTVASYMTDSTIGHMRYDFFVAVPAEGTYLDVAFIGLFNTAEYAIDYNFEQYKAPMWDADKSVVAHQSFDQFYYGDGGQDDAAAADSLLNLYHAATKPDWNKVADMVGSEYTVLTYWGWIATKADTIGQFGYQVNMDAPIFNDAWTVEAEKGVLDAAVAFGGVTGSRMRIHINTADFDGETTVRVLYKDAEGIVVCLNEITVISPKQDDHNFTSDISSNFATSQDDVNLKDSDIADLFDSINYGAGVDMFVKYNDGHPIYNVTHFTSMHTHPTGQYAFNINIVSIGGPEGFAGFFVRGYRDATREHNFFGADGNDAGGVSHGGAGIYLNYVPQEIGYALRINIKTYVDGKYIPNIYYAPVESSNFTVTDDGSTVSIFTDDKLIATIVISGTKDYGIDGVPADALAEKVVLTTIEGTFELTDACVAATMEISDLGVATRTGTVNFDHVSLMPYKSVEVPTEFYVPAEPEVELTNVALNKPASATQEDRWYTANKATNGTIGDEDRWSPLGNGEASLIVDLEQVYDLYGIKIEFEDSMWEYTISISEDGEAYTVIHEGERRSGNSTLELELNQEKARYIKITRLEDDGARSYWFSIYELYVFAPQA